MTIHFARRDFGFDGIERIRQKIVALLERNDLTEKECREALVLAHKVMGGLRASVSTRMEVKDRRLSPLSRYNAFEGSFVCNAIELPNGYDGDVELEVDRCLLVLTDRLPDLQFRFLRVPFFTTPEVQFKVTPENAILLGYVAPFDLNIPQEWRVL